MVSRSAAQVADGVVAPVTAQLRDDLRTVAVDHVSAHPDTKSGLANLLGVGVDSIDALLTAPAWDLQLSLRILSFLEVPVRVTRA